MSSSPSVATTSESNNNSSNTPLDADNVKTFRDFLANYNKLSEICFSDCVWDFTSRTVSRGEDTCAINCAEKYLKMNQRISTRFQVHNRDMQLIEHF